MGQVLAIIGGIILCCLFAVFAGIAFVENMTKDIDYGKWENEEDAER